MRNDDKKKYVELGKLLYKYRKQKGYSLRRAAGGVSIRKGIVSVFFVRSLETHF